MIRLLGVGNSLITGLQGAGKSHFVMSQVKQILDDMPEMSVYIANVDGIQLKSPNLHIVDANFSWVNDAQNNSLIIYDEAGMIDKFNNSNSRINSNEDVQRLTMARHQNKTIVFVAQDSSIVHPGVRKLLTRHFHFSNPYNDKQKTHCFVFPQVQDRLDGQNKHWQNNAIEEFKHTLDPDIFPLYKSVDDGVQHSKIKQVNQKAKRAKAVAIVAALLILPIMLLGAYLALSYYKDVWGKTEPQTTTQTEQPQQIATIATEQPAQERIYINDQNARYARTQVLYEQRLPKDYDIITSDDNLRPASAISMNGVCQVYNAYGDLMNYSKKDCEYLLEETGRIPKSRTNHRFVSQHPEAQEPTSHNASYVTIDQAQGGVQLPTTPP